MQIIVGPDWKSTAAGILSFALVTLGSIAAFLASLAAANPNPNYTLTILVAGVAFLTGLARAWVGWLQTYVQAVPATAPTVATVVTLPTTTGPTSSAVIVPLLVAAMVAFTLTGCARFVSHPVSGELAPGMPERQQAAQAAQNASIIVAGFQQGEIVAHDQKLISDDDHRFIQKELLVVHTVGKTTDSCIAKTTTNLGIVACVNTAVSTIDQINTDGGLHLKSDEAKADFQLAMIGTRTALATIAIILGGK